MIGGGLTLFYIAWKTMRSPLTRRRDLGHGRLLSNVSLGTLCFAKVYRIVDLRHAVRIRMHYV